MLKTIVYVDGFNLYYGALKGTPYKWLDLGTALGSLLGPRNDIVQIKYFTARVGDLEGNGAPQRQDSYIRALTSHDPRVCVIEGRYSVRPKRVYLDPPLGGTRFARAMVPEEKGSDVNLAVALVDDSWRNAFECAVIVSNDSDLVGALERVRDQDRSKRRLVVTPSFEGRRRTVLGLRKAAHRIFELGAPSHLATAQLPDPVVCLDTGMTISKPATW
ncbi:MAG: NYN domain-containing protein [Burkholderiaceae bacterium]